MTKTTRFKDKIKNIALKNHVPAQAVLQNFMMERLLERISISKHKDHFILKGGMLIASVVGITNRTTMDMDATLRGFPLTEESIRQALAEICVISVYDEITFLLNQVVPIRDQDEYGGYRASITARYEAISTPLKIDITTGDVITPAAIRYMFCSSFEDKVIDVWAYNLETILAEKVETILRRSVLNTRPRDFYDVYVIMKTNQDGIRKEIFYRALKATCDHRGSLSMLQNASNILDSIRSDDGMQSRWDRYCNDHYYAQGINFDDVLAILPDIIYRTGEEIRDG